MSSTSFYPNPKIVYPVEREDNGDTLVFNVQEVSPWTPKIDTSVSCNSEKNEDEFTQKQTLTCEDSLPNTPSMIDLLSVLDDEASCTDSSGTYEEAKEKKDEFVISWQKSDGVNERIIICIEDDPWLL